MFALVTADHLGNSNMLEGNDMKMLFSFTVMLALALAGFQFTSTMALAGDDHTENGAMVVAVATAGGFCGRSSEAGATGFSALACAPNARITGYKSLAAVTCGSNQWCCKHDIGGSGACTKCCNKP